MYGFSIQLELPFDVAVASVTEALNKEVLKLLQRVSASLQK